MPTKLRNLRDKVKFLEEELELTADEREVAEAKLDKIRDILNGVDVDDEEEDLDDEEDDEDF